MNDVDQVVHQIPTQRVDAFDNRLLDEDENINPLLKENLGRSSSLYLRQTDSNFSMEQDFGEITVEYPKD